MDFPQNMSMEEAFALAEAEAKLKQALSESKARFENAVIPNRLNEDWRFGRPHKHAVALAELLQSDTPSQGEATVQNAGEAAVSVTAEDDDLRQTTIKIQMLFFWTCAVVSRIKGINLQFLLIQKNFF